MRELSEAVERGEGQGPSVWGLLPQQLEALGCPGPATHVFGRLQRPWTWAQENPKLGRAVRDFLVAHTSLGLPRLVERSESSDGATRGVLALADERRIESVHMPRALARGQRVTLCVSSQVGCAMGCTFCATASMGLVRQLTAGEIVGQVLTMMRALGPQRGHELNLVFMGMGEPLHNLDALEHALRVLCHPLGLGLSPRRITVSTSGLVPGIARLARLEVRPRLALSLNATEDAVRERIMPVTRKWGLDALREALLAWPCEPRETITVEYVLLDGHNDRDEDAQRLIAWLEGIPHNLNVIPFNPHAQSDHRAVPEGRRRAFVQQLLDAGCHVSIRQNRGRDVRAACGQLVVDGARRPRAAAAAQ